jgi:spore coat protein CotH
MKIKQLYFFFALLFIVACDPTDVIDSNDNKLNTGYVYDINSIPKISIQINTSDWNQFLDYYDQNKHNEEYVAANISFDKDAKPILFDSIGLRLRGNTSRRRPEGKTGEVHNSTSPDWHHASFTIKFNQYKKGQKLSGLERINLKWFKDDANYVRELYCYDLFERFGVWTAPQASYCRLEIDVKEDKAPAYFGVYLMVEAVNEDYLEARKAQFGDTNGFLWKANWGADFKSADRTKMGVEEKTLTNTYEPIYNLKNNTEQLSAAKTQLANFITNLNNKSGDNFKQWVDTTMDVELLLKTYATNVMCGMWDDYWNNKNNFYFYFDTKDKFYFIPYDYDNTLGTSLIMDDSGKQDVMNWGDNSHPLIKKILNIPSYATLYQSYLKELANNKNDLFHVTKSTQRIRNWQNMISPYVHNDTGEDMEIIDKPASWGNCGFYRLLDTENNFFSIRASNLPN